MWRKTNPALAEADRHMLVDRLMRARWVLRPGSTPEERAAARREVDAAKRALGERGPVWWSDGAPDYNRKLVKNTPYAEWFRRVRSGK